VGFGMRASEIQTAIEGRTGALVVTSSEWYRRSVTPRPANPSLPIGGGEGTFFLERKFQIFNFQFSIFNLRTAATKTLRRTCRCASSAEGSFLGEELEGIENWQLKTFN